ncbi:hypothetical protein BDZ91DRAFT_725420 [Kalaharituber pfeilii]|nr:hypothetical protein BDZ91DRAFT_725420 [Kalaharituber pfeilii]
MPIHRQPLASPQVSVIPLRHAPVTSCCSNVVCDEQLQPLSRSSFNRLPPYYVDIDKTDRIYKERLASAMVSNISRGEMKRPQLHLIMLVGLVASGKTTLAKSIVQAFSGYVLVTGGIVENEDLWEEEWDKCVFAAKAAFSSGMNVISDLSNESPVKRWKWIQLAQEYGASIDAIVLDTSVTTCHQRISNLYTGIYGDNPYAVEMSQPYHHRLRRVASRYSKPASVEFAGRVIYLPEGVQSCGHWSAEKLRRFLPDVMAQHPRKTLISSMLDSDGMPEDDLFSADTNVGETLPTGTSIESRASFRFTGQSIKDRRYGSMLSSSLSSLPLLDTTQEHPMRRCSPNAIAIRASPRRRKRTHERRPTVAIAVSELAAKASAPSTFQDNEEDIREMPACLKEDSMHTKRDAGIDDSMNELILECPTSPLREDLDTRRAFAAVADYGNNSQQASKTFTSSKLSSSTPPTSPVAISSNLATASQPVYKGICSLPSSIRKEQCPDLFQLFQLAHISQAPTMKYNPMDYVEGNMEGKQIKTSEERAIKQEDCFVAGNPTLIGIRDEFSEINDHLRNKESAPNIQQLGKLIDVVGYGQTSLDSSTLNGVLEIRSVEKTGCITSKNNLHQQEGLVVNSQHKHQAR